MAAMVSSESWRLRSTPESSAPKAPATRRMVRVSGIDRSSEALCYSPSGTGCDMDQLTARFDADADAHAQRMREQGYTVIEDFLDAEGLAGFRTALAPFMGTHH